MNTSPRLNLPLWLIAAGLSAMLMLTAQTSLAGSASWLGGYWENPASWTPGGPPNGPSDVATFSTHYFANCYTFAPKQVDSIVITYAAPPGPYMIGLRDGAQLIIKRRGRHRQRAICRFPYLLRLCRPWRSNIVLEQRDGRWSTHWFHRNKGRFGLQQRFECGEH